MSLLVKHLGEVNVAVTLNGRGVKRLEAIPVPQWNEVVPCAPYDNHFIYDNSPSQGGKPDQPSYMCTCGSAAVATSVNPTTGRVVQGFPKMFVCLQHATTGRHTNAS